MDQDQPDVSPGGDGLDSEGVSPALESLDSMRAVAMQVLDSPFWRLSDAEARQAVSASFAVLQQAYAVYLATVAELDSRPEAVEGARPGQVAKTFLVHGLRRTSAQAGAEVRAALTLSQNADPAAGGLPRLGAALAAGEISREHAAVGVRAMNRIPRKMLAEPLPEGEESGAGVRLPDSGEGDSGEGDGSAGDSDWCEGRPLCRGDLVDQLLVDHAKRFDPGTTDKVAEYLLNAVDPDGSRSFDPDAVQRRGLSLVQDSTGMGIIRGELDQATSAIVRAALEAFNSPDPARTETAEDGTLIEVKDGRSARQRNVDALGVIARLALGTLSSGSTRGGEPPRIVIHTDLESLAAARAQEAPGAPSPENADARGSRADRVPGASAGQRQRPAAGLLAEFASGDLVDPGLLGRFSCDSVLQTALLARNGAVLDLGRDVRTVSPAQRRALVARDRGCVIPGCTAPAAWCDAHHVRWWRHCGGTDIGNLALVCSRHHTLIHQGIWVLEMRDGVPWATPPAWAESQRSLIRNTYRDDAAAMHRLGVQLRLGFDPDEHSDPPDQPDQTHPPDAPGLVA